MTARPAKPRPWILAGNLCGLLRRAGYPSLRAAALALGERPAALWQICRGIRHPTPATLARILESLGATETDLIRCKPAPPGWGRDRTAR